MIDDSRNEPVFVISIVAKRLSVHPQTLRLYERCGLVNPQRRGQVRLYSEADIERLRTVLRLRDELGVNLAGIEVILNLLSRIEELQQEVERARDQGKRRLERVTQNW
jgi:MerR family transcriptional regulator, heat shock protein HspR